MSLALSAQPVRQAEPGYTACAIIGSWCVACVALTMGRADRRSAEAAQYRKLYKTARWIRLRQWILDRDPLCRYCMQDEIVEEAEVVDHIKPHKGDLDLFWNPDNLQPLCRACHDGRKQREDRGTYIAFGPDGWPL